MGAPDRKCRGFILIYSLTSTRNKFLRRKAGLTAANILRDYLRSEFCFGVKASSILRLEQAEVFLQLSAAPCHLKDPQTGGRKRRLVAIKGLVVSVGGSKSK
ncbi:MAG: hypothetical protein C4324_09855 [Blastocatellia bacterium]